MKKRLLLLALLLSIPYAQAQTFVTDAESAAMRLMSHRAFNEARPFVHGYLLGSFESAKCSSVMTNLMTARIKQNEFNNRLSQYMNSLPVSNISMYQIDVYTAHTKFASALGYLYNAAQAACGSKSIEIVDLYEGLSNLSMDVGAIYLDRPRR